MTMIYDTAVNPPGLQIIVFLQRFSAGLFLARRRPFHKVERPSLVAVSNAVKR
jgi:hypothetical protein